MAEKQTYPRIPEKNWWILRDQFKKTLPSTVSVSYLKSLLGLTSDGAAQNLLPPLRQLGLIDDENKPTDLANAWRIDSKYPDVCQQMLENVYPPELLDLYSGKDIDKEAVTQWFMDVTAQGRGTARQAAAMYILLNDATPRSSDDFKKTPTPGTAMKPTRHKVIRGKAQPPETEAPQPQPEKGAASDRIAPVGESAPAVFTDTWSRELSVHIDLQINISPEATPEQIDQIFASMAKHLPFPKRET